jgi:anaerobic ribonucleoside-triphosphate reductase activating protein
MIKYTEYIIGYREFPDEMSLLINISGCPNKCSGCHSSYLQNDIGEELTTDVLDNLILNNKGITCIGFMGGDQAPQEVVKLSQYVKQKYKNLHTGWYSGKEVFPLYHGTFDYIKLGPYKEELGPIDNPSTNQRMYMNISNNSDLNATFIDITEKAFWAPKPWDVDYFDYFEEKKKENKIDFNQK